MWVLGVPRPLDMIVRGHGSLYMVLGDPEDLEMVLDCLGALETLLDGSAPL